MTSGKMIMASIADSIELFHREGWNKIEKEMPASMLPHFRKKVDLLLYRIYNRLTCAVQMEVRYASPCFASRARTWRRLPISYSFWAIIWKSLARAWCLVKLSMSSSKFWSRLRCDYRILILTDFWCLVLASSTTIHRSYLPYQGVVSCVGWDCWAKSRISRLEYHVTNDAYPQRHNGAVFPGIHTYAVNCFLPLLPCFSFSSSSSLFLLLLLFSSSSSPPPLFLRLTCRVCAD